MMDMPLLPCPFCAGTPELQDHRTIWCVTCNCGACVLGERAPEPETDMTDWAHYKQTAITVSQQQDQGRDDFGQASTNL